MDRRTRGPHLSCGHLDLFALFFCSLLVNPTLICQQENIYNSDFMLKRFLAILWGVWWCGAERGGLGEANLRATAAVEMSPKGLINTVHKQIHQHHRFHFLLPLSLSIPLLFSSFALSCISYSWVQGNNSVQHIQRYTSSSISISFHSALLLTDPFGNSSSKKKWWREKNPHPLSSNSNNPALRLARGSCQSVWKSQSVGGERWGGGLQGAGGVWTSHVREEVGVRAQLVDIEPVLLTVGQTAADKCLQRRGNGL